MTAKESKKSELSQLPGKKWALQIPALIVSIAIAGVLAYSEIIPTILVSSSATSYLIASFIAGFFFSSFFGVAPATVAFIEMAPQAPSILLMGIFGGLGAMVGDLSIFHILKFGIIDDLVAYFQRYSRGGFNKVFSLPVFRYLLIFFGAIFVATPIPDEIGLAMMGIARMKWYVVGLAGFILNGIGIYLLCVLAKAIAL